MKLLAASILALALHDLFTIASGFDENVCIEGEKQCILTGQIIDQCINGKWATVKVCKPGDTCIENPTPRCALNRDQNEIAMAEWDISTLADAGTDIADSSVVTEDCHHGDAKCKVLPPILLGRHAIKRCNDHKWFADEVCIPGYVCNAEPYPHCVGVKAIEARERDNDENSIDADQVNKFELPCSKCKRFRDQCIAIRSPHCRAQIRCLKECTNKMKRYLVEDGNHGRYRGTCQYYCPHLCK